jgi:hypothetical protein
VPEIDDPPGPALNHGAPEASRAFRETSRFRRAAHARRRS